MRVLMVSNTYAPARNGVAQCVSVLRRELTARGHTVEVLTGRLPGCTRDPGVHEVAIVPGFAEDFPLPIAVGLPRTLRGRRFDIVHVHHPELLGPLGLTLAEDSGAVPVFTAHSVYTDYLDHYLGGVGRPLKAFTAERIGRFLDRFELVLAPSSDMARVMRAWGVTSRIERLEAATDIGERVPRDEARRRLGVPSDARLALAVSRLAPEKRVDVLIGEFELALPLVPNALLVVIGDGRQRESLLRLASRLGLEARVHVLPEVPHDRLGLWYAAADVHVSASRSETGPLTVVEAMAAGVPTVAYAGPGFEDRIVSGDNGLLVDDVPGELAAGMALVMADEFVREALAAGAKAYAPVHAPGRVAETLLGYYEELLK